MEISLLKALLNNVSSFIHLSSYNSNNSNLVQKFYQKAEEILKLLKPILDAIVDSEIAFDEVLNEIFEKLGQSVDELRDFIQMWQPLSSKSNFVLQCELSISKLQASVLDCFQLLKSFDQHLPDELSSSSLEYCIEKIKHMGHGQTTSTIKEAAKKLVDGVGLSSEILCKIAELLCLGSNQEILIEAVALEKLKENAEQGEKIREAEFFDQMISLVTQMHDRLVRMKQSQTSSPVPIPADFCCPLSLELMTDPVIVASGQTYERAFIKNWIELGLNVCPKTRQTLSHINLIPNFTVKALIANWCETNHVKLPDPKKSVGLNQSSPLIVHAEAGSTKDMNILSHARGDQQMSPESTLSASSPGKNVTSSTGIHRERSPLHTRSAVAGHGQSLNMGRLSLVGPGERALTSGDGCVESVSHHSAPLCRNDVSSAVTADRLLSQGHIRSASASSALNSEIFSQGYPGDANESSGRLNDVSSYSSDYSGEVKAESQLSTSVNNPNREPEFPLRLRETLSWSQTIWRRPSDRLVPRIVSSPAVETRADLSGVEAQVQNLVEDLKSPSIDTQRMAAAELRQLAKHNTDNRIVIANCGAISLLVNLLSCTDTEIQENAVTALLNLSINDNNKVAIANAEVIEPLIHVLKTASPAARENSAATLFSLSVIEENKVKIGRSGAIGPLVDLLGNGTPRGKKDAATALFNLSIFHENKARIVQAGAVKHLVELMDPAAGMVDKAVAVLANLATIPEGRTQIGEENGIPVLVEVVELGSARGKENAASALLQLCTNSSRFCNRVLQEGAVPPLVALSQSGTPRAKEKAQALLSYFRSQRHGKFVILVKCVSMGPDLEKKEKIRAGMEMHVVKANGNVLGSTEDALKKGNFNYEDQYFQVEALPCEHDDGVDQHEDMEVNVDYCLTTLDKKQVEVLHEDATESLSSFGDTDEGSGAESDLGDTEVESELRFDLGRASILDECVRLFGMRKKRPTDHWRRFIRPIMWRCKWIELQLNEFQNQALKYDRELDEIEQRKAFDLGTFLVEDFHVKSLPFSRCTERQKAMKRKKRKRLEETTNVASYMAQHNLFSYYDYKNNPAGGFSVDDQGNNRDGKISGSHGLGPHDGWINLEIKDNDNLEEQFLRKIEVLQTRVCKLRARIDNVVSRIPNEFFDNMLCLSTPSDALYSSDPEYASSLQNGASSHGEITPLSHIIEITALPHTGGSCGNGEEQILINNPGAKEEIHDLRNFACHFKEEEHQPMMGKCQALELVSRAPYGGKSLPKCSSMFSITKRKRGKRR